jgi:hypothetical protein
MATSFSKEYLGQRLFHFWRHEDPKRAFEIFASIVQRGLLLSRATAQLIDSFPCRCDDGQIRSVEIVQNARVCLTDIPEDKLTPMYERYGRCAVGFSREQVLAWGGLPVWYLPNRCYPGTLSDAAAAFLWWTDEARVLVRLLVQLLEQTGTPLIRAGQPLAPAEARREVQRAEQAILRLSSFLKEMSSKEADDHCYLYEREWRIVSGCASHDFGDPCRKPTHGERAELLKQRPEWEEPMRANDPKVTAQLSGTPLIDGFWYFNGIPRRGTVSQAIEVVLVPDSAFGDRVREYVKAYPDQFRQGGPEVRVAA